MNPTEEARQISQVLARLSTRFSDVSPQAVETAVEDAVAQYAGSPIRDLVPLLVERTAAMQLAAPMKT
ncbi:three-helix bundle dimerization domain-containing protein [Rhodococcus sp. NPDC057014]|uniref:three-helix bundle dimerization domain-containing protein n=1 Tax=Rhodococcus sp. NPDC057014 TaxID=3346000 RepID=UPI003633C3D0